MSMLMVEEDVPLVVVSLPATVRRTEKGRVEAKLCVTTRPVPLGVPSPKFQVKLEAFASVSVAVHVTGDPLAALYLPLNWLIVRVGPLSVLALEGGGRPVI